MKVLVNTQPFNKVVKITPEQRARVQESGGTLVVKPSNIDGIRVQFGDQGTSVVHSGIHVPADPLPQPTEGGNTIVRTADTPISGHRCVVDTDSGVIYLSLADLSHGERILGITLNAAGVGDPLNIQYSGEVTNSGWNWTPDEPIFPIENGMLSQTPPTTGFVCNIGFASSATSIFINIQQAVYL